MKVKHSIQQSILDKRKKVTPDNWIPHLASEWRFLSAMLRNFRVILCNRPRTEFETLLQGTNSNYDDITWKVDYTSFNERSSVIYLRCKNLDFLSHQKQVFLTLVASIYDKLIGLAPTWALIEQVFHYSWQEIFYQMQVFVGIWERWNLQI